MFRRDQIRLIPMSEPDQSVLRRMAQAFRKLNPPDPRNDWDPAYQQPAIGARFYSPTEAFRQRYAHVRVRVRR